MCKGRSGRYAENSITTPNAIGSRIKKGRYKERAHPCNYTSHRCPKIDSKSSLTTTPPAHSRCITCHSEPCRILAPTRTRHGTRTRGIHAVKVRLSNANGFANQVELIKVPGSIHVVGIDHPWSKLSKSGGAGIAKRQV